jgi:hypothetical protein
MPPPKGVNLGDFKADDSDIGRDGHVAPHHRLEPWGPISSLPLSLLWPRALIRIRLIEFPKHDTGSWMWRATRRVNLGGYRPPLAMLHPSGALSRIVVRPRMQVHKFAR